MTARYYPAIIERSSDGFYVFFPDLDGCTSVGETIEDAARNAEEGLRLHIEGSLELGYPVAEPSALDAVQVGADIDEVARTLVRVELPGQLVTGTGGSAPDYSAGYSAGAVRPRSQ